MTLFRTAGPTLAGALALVALAASPAHAQKNTNYESYTSYNGMTLSSVAGCPGITWRLVRNPKGEVHGYATYADLSGVSFVKGMLGADGNFKLDLTPTGIGAGPSGHATGHRAANGEVDGTLTGSGCANATIAIPPDTLAYPPGQ